MRVELPRRPLRPVLSLVLAAFAAIIVAVPSRACALDKETSQRTTLIVFAHRPMHEDQWNALFAAMRRGLVDGGEKQLPGAESVDMLRGTDVRPGLQVDNAIMVSLEGDCTLLPTERTVAMGALGWVLRKDGVIGPYIHVECDRITQMLGPFALGMSRERRDTVMGEAITRVILHEWVHIATQSARHRDEGISKSSFGITDLMKDDIAIWKDPRFPHVGRKPKL